MRVPVTRITMEYRDVERAEDATNALVNWYTNTEEGKWVNLASYKPLEYDLVYDPQTFMRIMHVSAWLKDEALTFYTLKWK